MIGEPVISFYLTFLIVVGLVAIGGVEGTLRLVQYIELKLKTYWIEFRLSQMKRRLKKGLTNGSLWIKFVLFTLVVTHTTLDGQINKVKGYNLLTNLV